MTARASRARIEPYQGTPRGRLSCAPRHYAPDQIHWCCRTVRFSWNAQKAPLSAAATKRPLIVLSHGTGGGAATMAWLAETLASNGYIVAAVNNHGNTAAEPSYQLHGFMLWWERARDISVLIDRLVADPQSGAHIDRSRIGVAGFSLGGYTALAMVGEEVHRRVGTDALKFFDRTLQIER
ncbi:MAG: hypothetical protein DMD75_16240 [Candidatus Rokuibacteriota bacterium]|nr:MAG: hypothetical protein DMD75_16240 [Candidatus Rokubacteria bacterium]